MKKRREAATSKNDLSSFNKNVRDHSKPITFGKENLQFKSYKELYDMLWNDPVAQDYELEMRKKLVQINITGQRLRENRELRRSRKNSPNLPKLTRKERNSRIKVTEEADKIIQMLAYIEDWSGQKYVEGNNKFYDHVMCAHN